MSFTKEQGNPGSSEDETQNVNLVADFSVPVEGYPDANVKLFAPNGDASNLPLIVYIHGGGWCTGTSESVEWYAKLLSSNGFCVANVDYSLAPKHMYPASTIQLTETINYLYDNARLYGYDINNIFIGGNSAGAHLSSQLGAIFTDGGYANTIGVQTSVPAGCIKGLILYNGVYNFSNLRKSKFPFVNYLAWAYTGKRNYENFERIDELSTVKHISTAYPSVFITVGDTDPLEYQTLEFIEMLKTNEVDFTSLLWTDTNAGLWHDYIYDQTTAEENEAYKNTIEFIKEHVS